MNCVKKFVFYFASDGKIALSAFINLWVKFPQLDSKAYDDVPLDVCSFFIEADDFNLDFDRVLVAYLTDVLGS
jgi:hypothetical protein